MNRNKYVFDVNTLISAVLIKNSIPAASLDKALTIGDIVLSDSILAELTEVIFRRKFDKYLTDEQRLEFLEKFERRALKLEVTMSITDCRDPKDNKYLELALTCNADCIITGDDDLLTLNPYKGIPIINAADFIKLF
jgi:putative PIN family toxin of toxin-antitoxin system